MDDDDDLAPDTVLTPVAGFETTAMSIIPAPPVDAAPTVAMPPVLRRADTDVDATPARAFARLGTPRPGTDSDLVITSRRMPTEAEWPPTPPEPASARPRRRLAAIYETVPEEDFSVTLTGSDDWF